jgi:hypothetical protein
MSDSLSKNNSPCSEKIDYARRLRENFNATLERQYRDIACHLRLVLQSQKFMHPPVDLAAFLAPDLTGYALSIVRQVTEEVRTSLLALDEWSLQSLTEHDRPRRIMSLSINGGGMIALIPETYIKRRHFL